MSMAIRKRRNLSACLDVSDGVLQNLGHLCAQSDVGADSEIERRPLEPRHRELVAQVGEDAEDLAPLGGARQPAFRGEGDRAPAPRAPGSSSANGARSSSCPSAAR
jgi:thiamine-monophosphate kinase